MPQDRPYLERSDSADQEASGARRNTPMSVSDGVADNDAILFTIHIICDRIQALSGSCGRRHSPPLIRAAIANAVQDGKELYAMTGTGSFREIRSEATSSRWENVKVKGKKLGAGAVVAFTAAGIGLGVSGCGNNNAGATPETPSTPAATAPETPGASDQTTETAEPQVAETTKSREELVQEFEIEVGLSAEEWAKQYNDRLDKWQLAGADQDLYDATRTGADGTGPNLEAVCAAEAAVNRELYGDALYVSDWRNQSTLATVADQKEKSNALDIYQWVINHDQPNYGQPGTNFPEYKLWSEVTNVRVVRESADGSRQIIFSGIEYNNADDIYYDSINAAALDGEPFKISVITAVENGKEKVSYIGNGEEIQ